MAENATGDKKGARWAGYWLIVIVVAAATVGVMLLAQNISTRKSEAKQTAFKLTDLTETTVDPVEWGKNFPRQYDGYIRTADNERTRYGGSEAFPVEPGGALKPESKLEHNPRLVTIFNGYAFALDYRERRGHAFMLHDQRETDRVKLKPQPGACMQCHASNVVAYRKAGIDKGAPGTLDEPFLSAHGQAQLFKGFEAVCPLPFDEASKIADHPVSCIDCHDPKTLALRVTRPGFLNGIAALAESSEPTPHLPSIEQWRKGSKTTKYDPNTLASRQEMRSMACGQCHVEYYFKGDGKLVTYPWNKGLKVEQIEAYYDEVGWSDWKHKDTGAQVLKAQHPEFELWSQGIHARSGVSCADCHMPYKREGAIKISEHQVRSPMLSVARSCQVCHNYAESEIQSRVAAIQDRTKAQLDRAEIAVVDLINSIKDAKAAGASDDQLKEAWALQRKAQWRSDYINAENSMGFHAPQETMRILGEAIDYARQGQVELLKKGLGAKTAAAPGDGPAQEPSGKPSAQADSPK